MSSPLQKLTSTLREWKISSYDPVTRFQYAAGHNQQQITASLERSSGPGWEAAIHGQQAVSLVTNHCDRCDCVL